MRCHDLTGHRLFLVIGVGVKSNERLNITPKAFLESYSNFICYAIIIVHAMRKVSDFYGI